MAYINLEFENQLPGIRGLMAFRPETAQPMNILAEALLCTDAGGLSRGDRELIAAYVSFLNDCMFCQNVQGAAASCHYQDEGKAFNEVRANFDHAELSSKMRALLVVAKSVQKGGKFVTPDQINEAKLAGATDLEIHDTVLIAAAFCMFNRYVDGLNTWAPEDQDAYDQSGIRIKQEGYANFDPKKMIVERR